MENATNFGTSNFVSVTCVLVLMLMLFQCLAVWTLFSWTGQPMQCPMSGGAVPFGSKGTQTELRLDLDSNAATLLGRKSGTKMLCGGTVP